MLGFVTRQPMIHWRKRRDCFVVRLTVHAFWRTAGRQLLFSTVRTSASDSHCYQSRCCVRLRFMMLGKLQSRQQDLNLIQIWIWWIIIIIILDADLTHTHSDDSQPGPGLELGNMCRRMRRTPQASHISSISGWADALQPATSDRSSHTPHRAGMVPRPWFDQPDQVAGLINKLPTPSTKHAPPDSAQWSISPPPADFITRPAQSAPPSRFLLPLGNCLCSPTSE